MTTTLPEQTTEHAATTERTATPRRVLMCRPDHFTVSYRINPWMRPELPTDTALAVRQWEELVRVYRSLGFAVELVEPVPGLPDMVYAANGGFVVDGVALGARFTHAERAAEGPAYMAWFRGAGLSVHEPDAVNEGEGDLLLVGDVVLAGTGFRSAPRSHAEVARLTGREVVTLELVDPHYYHLDTALAVLEPGTPDAEPVVAYLPSAFSAASRAELERRFPDAVLATPEDAAVLGLNAFSDGRHVVVAARAETFQRDLRARGFVPVPVDLSELLLGGGGVKCCTLELR